MTIQDTAHAEIERLVKSFKDIPAAQRKGMNEMQTRLGYILPLFKALGWDTSNINEVSPEEKVSRGWVDFSFRIGNVPRFFLETKKVNEDLTDPKWVKQAIDYAWTKSVTWALLSDFEGLRVFNAEWKESNPFSAQFFELNIDTYLTDFERLWWLSKAETVSRRLDAEAEKVGKKVKRQPVSQYLFDDLKTWRGNLFKNYKAFNLGYSAAQIDEAVLRLLNRLIFIRTAEDREVEDNRLRTLVRVLKDKKQIAHLDRELAALFREMDGVYNSELFARHFSEELQIPPTDLEEIIEGLYEKNFTRYNFNALDADVLGTAYEQYLGHVVAVGVDETHVEEKRTKRKSQGIYYTPTFVTKYIVQQTVGTYLDEHGYHPSKPLRVLDMACGSGSFLIEAFDVIDDFVAKQRGHAQRGEVDFHDRMRQLEVLENCIYGVDKDKQAVEVARLNLLLRGLHSREKLPMLENIAHGNSLHQETFEDSFSQVMKEGGFDVIVGNPPYVRIQTLDKTEVEFFNQNFESATGNYDIYVLFVERAMQLLKPGGVMGFILPNKFMQSDYGMGLRKILSEQKVVAQVLDFGDAQVFQGASTYTCVLILRKQNNPDFEYTLVPDPTTIITNTPHFHKIDSNKLNSNAWAFSVGANSNITERLIGAYPSLGELASKIYVGLQTSADTVFLFKKFSKLGKDRLTVESKALSKFVEIEKDLLKPVIRSGEIGRYFATPSALVLFPYKLEGKNAVLIPEKELKKDYPLTWKYLKENKELLENREHGKFKESGWYQLYPKNLNLWEQPKLMLPYMVTRLAAHLDETDNCYFVNVTTGGFGVTLKDSSLLKYVTGLLNSKLLDFLFRSQATKFHGGYFGANKQFIENLPIRRIDFAKTAEKSAHDEIVKLVKKMLRLQKERQSVRPEEDLDRVRKLEREIVRVDEEIDRRVYVLYGLSPDEIRIVDGKE